MSLKLLLLLMIGIHWSHAFRETPAVGRKVFHTIEEGHDLNLTCPIAESDKDGSSEAAILWTRGQSDLELFSVDGTGFFKYVNTLNPTLRRNYRITGNESETRLTLISASRNDKIGHPGQYKCTITKTLTSKKFHVTVVKDLKCNPLSSPLTLDGTYFIECQVQRSFFHEGQVKFILRLGDHKMDESFVNFPKNQENMIKATIPFTASKNYQGGEEKVLGDTRRSNLHHCYRRDYRYWLLDHEEKGEGQQLPSQRECRC